MTWPYPPSNADRPDAPGDGLADLNYADAAAPPEQPPAPLPPSGQEAPEQHSGLARVYSWPSPQPAVLSEVDPSTVESDVDTVDAAPDGHLSTVDDNVADLESSIVDEVEPGSTVELAAEETNQPEAEPEPTDPAVARMRAVQARLGEFDDLPIEEHPARYEELHSELTGALAQIDRAPDNQA